MSTNPVIIELKHATKRFGDFVAVSDASFRVYKSEVVGFVGANGAGKTTTISMLLGFISPSGGAAKIFGNTIMPASAHMSHQKIGYAAGDMELPARLTGKQYLKFVLSQHQDDNSTRLQELIEKFQPELDKKIHELSRGNKQKLALIAAFAPKPAVVVLDEPTSGLDPMMQEVFLDLVRYEQSQGTTIFMSSHYLSEVVDVCSRIILMRKGNIIQDVATVELLTGGKHVLIITSYKHTKPPKGASEIEQTVKGGQLELSFMWDGEMAVLQAWLASVKQLTDVNITEHDLDALVHSLYAEDGANV